VRIIDAHCHLSADPAYLEAFLEAMGENGIEKACVSGLGPLFDQAGNDDVKRAFEKHPGRVIGAVFVRPGVDGPDAIDRGHDGGFRMVKITIPKSGYEDPAYFPLWERAQEHGMPVLFHTGVVTVANERPGEGISSWNMHPMRLEPITREFPEMGVIIAHLGIHWNTDAAELARMCPNVYVDLTGEPGAWRARADAEGMENYLWWDGAFDKVVFGTDVHYVNIPTIITEDIARLQSLGVGEETRRRIFSGNILHLLGEE
jgi:predicted TIM-barrel fold metal-dependent hydrolase